MRQITAFLFVLSGEKKETSERKPGRLEGRMRTWKCRQKAPTWLEGDGAGLPIATADQLLNCTHELSSDGGVRSILLTNKEPLEHKERTRKNLFKTLKADDLDTNHGEVLASLNLLFRHRGRNDCICFPYLFE